MMRLGTAIASALALWLLPSTALAQGLSGGGMKSGGSTVNGATISPATLDVQAPTGVECVAGFDSPDTSTRGICLNRAGGSGISGAEPYLWWNSGAGSAGLSNGGGPLVFTPATGNGNQTDSMWYSTRTAGNCAFQAATEGAYYCIGPDTQLLEEGTRVRVRDGVDGTAGSGTGFTVNATSNVAHRVHKITITEAALSAAAGTEDENVWLMPAGTRMIRMVGVVGTAFTGPSITDVKLTCGTSAGGTQYLTSQDVDVLNAVLGDAAADIGAGLTSSTVADIPSMTATTQVQCRFTCTGANCSVMTAGSITLYLEHLVFP